MALLKHIAGAAAMASAAALSVSPAAAQEYTQKEQITLTEDQLASVRIFRDFNSCAEDIASNADPKAVQAYETAMAEYAEKAEQLQNDPEIVEKLEVIQGLYASAQFVTDEKELDAIGAQLDVLVKELNEMAYEKLGPAPVDPTIQAQEACVAKAEKSAEENELTLADIEQNLQKIESTYGNGTVEALMKSPSL